MAGRKGVKHLNYVDRLKIEALSANKKTAKEIAAYLGRDLSCIYKELKRGIEGRKVAITKKRKIKARAVWYDQMKAQIVEKPPEAIQSSDDNEKDGENGKEGQE